jgi:transposase
MSRRAAAARFGVSESSAIKWVQRFERSGSRAASKMGGYLRPRLEPRRELIARERDRADITRRLTKEGTMIYSERKHDCEACPLKPKCCPNTPARKIARSVHEAARGRAL